MKLEGRFPINPPWPDMRALCLGSGEGGFLKAFEADERWTIVRVDFDEKYADVPHTIIRDITQWMDWENEIGRDFDLVIFSPDCREFSTAGQRRPPGFTPSLELLLAGLDLIKHIEPHHYLVENVKGARRHFQPFLGRPRQILGPFYFWGNFPWLDVNVRRITAKSDNSSGYADNDPRREGRWVFNGKQYYKWGEKNKARIPFEISDALRKATNDHVGLERWGF